MQNSLLSTDHGPPPPEDYIEMIKAEFVSPLINPDSPIYTFKTPVKGYTTRNRIGNLRSRYGWVVCGTVNSKPAYGAYAGYSGPKPFFVLFKNGNIAEKLVGWPWDNNYGRSYRMNIAVMEVCDRAAAVAIK